jgi:arylsulfatase A-like enzyme
VDGRLLASIDLAPTMIDIAGSRKPPKMEGEPFLGASAGAPRRYVFGARDRCDETVFRFRTVRDARYRYIRNFTPERPFLQPNDYKERSYPVWNLLKELNAKRQLTPVQAVLCAPTMPADELFDLDGDPHEIKNLAGLPEHRQTLERLRSALEEWIRKTGDKGSVMEPPDVVERKGLTKAGGNPSATAIRPERKRSEP